MNLLSVNRLRGFTLRATDGEAGRISELLFEDEHWKVRYVVVDTGNWLHHHRVLMPPAAIVEIRESAREIRIGLTKRQLEESPENDSDPPVSRQRALEEEATPVITWPAPLTGVPSLVPIGRAVASPTFERFDPHLRSTRAVAGYRANASGGKVGHVADFILQEPSWTIRYLVVNTGSWRPGKKVLVAAGWAERVSWKESSVYFGVSPEAIKHAPKYHPDSPICED
jgi:uncharacterized protein YrrD